MSIDRKFENFLIKWDGDRKPANHSVNEVVKWLVERGVAAARATETLEQRRASKNAPAKAKWRLATWQYC